MLLVCAANFVCKTSEAQDTLFFRTKKIEVGKVSQIGGGTVLFMPDTFSADKVVVKYRASSIHKISYQSGRIDTVWGNSLYQYTANLFINHQLPHRHELDISIYKIWKKNYLIQYTYYLRKRNFSLTVPLNFTQNNYNFLNANNLIKPRFSTGLILRTHSNNQSKFGFYAGLGVLYGYSNIYNYDPRIGTENLGEKYFINPIINFGYQHYFNNLLYLVINSAFGPSFYPYHRKLDEALFNLEGRLGFRIK